MNEIEELMNRMSNGDIPSGYLKRKLGIYPSDWEEAPLNSICSFVDYRGKTPKKTENGVFLLTAKNIKNGYIDYNASKEYISENDFGNVMGRGMPSEGDVVITTEAPLGNVAQLSSSHIAIAQRVIKLRANERITNDYLKEYLLSEDFQLELQREATGTTVRGIKGSRLKKIRITFPSLDEQKRITEILRTSNEIVKLKRLLLNNKQKQMKALVQRFYSFDSGDTWKWVKASELFDSINDKTHKGNGDVLSSTQDSGIVLRENLNIDIKYDKKSLVNYKYIKQGDFVISLRSFQGGIEFSKYEGLLSPAYTVLRNKVEIDPSFYKHLFKSDTFIRKLNGLVYGIRDGKQISFKDFSTMKLPYPSLKIQKEISDILDTAMIEIELLSSEIELLEIRRKSLMKLLLRGILRV